MKDEKQDDFSKTCYDLARISAINSLYYFISKAEKAGNEIAIDFFTMSRLALKNGLKALASDKDNSEQ